MSDSKPNDPAALVHEMQVLTDIEGDLADTAVAVTATTEVPITQNFADDAMMQNAEAMESVLEQSIPPAPAVEEPLDIAPKETFPTEMQIQVQPKSDGDALEPLVEPSVAASDAKDALTTVADDIDTPVLPETVVTASHDVVTETAMEESTSDIIIDVEEPTSENIAEAGANVEDVPASIPSNHVSPPSIPTIADVTQEIEPSEPVPSNNLPIAIPMQTPYASIQEKKGDVSLPEGLSEQSPSVMSLPDLIRSYRTGTVQSVGLSMD